MRKIDGKVREGRKERTVKPTGLPTSRGSFLPSTSNLRTVSPTRRRATILSDILFTEFQLEALTCAIALLGPGTDSLVITARTCVTAWPFAR